MRGHLLHIYIFLSLALVFTSTAAAQTHELKFLSLSRSSLSRFSKNKFLSRQIFHLNLEF
ncbi:hypothetical protein LguiA_013504 [Lonicera macranthoides]